MNFKFAIFRVPNYATKDASQLAEAVTAPAALQPISLTDAFAASIQGGAALAELGLVYTQMNNAFVVNLRAALNSGNLVQAGILLQIAHNRLNWSDETMNAINAVLAANSLRLVDVVAREQGEEPPEQVSAADVTATLTEAGYSWDGDRWNYGI